MCDYEGKRNDQRAAKYLGEHLRGAEWCGAHNLSGSGARVASIRKSIKKDEEQQQQRSS